MVHRWVRDTLFHRPTEFVSLGKRGFTGGGCTVVPVLEETDGGGLANVVIGVAAMLCPARNVVLPRKEERNVDENLVFLTIHLTIKLSQSFRSGSNRSYFDPFPMARISNPSLLI